MVEARKRKETRYPELQQGRCRLVVTAMEVGGRWSEEAHAFLQVLAEGRGKEAPALLRGSAYRHWLRRWSSLISVAGMRAFANTLLFNTAEGTEVLDGAAPTLGQLLGDEPHLKAPAVSRLRPY